MIPDDRTLDTVTAADWRAASEVERRAFRAEQGRRGFVSFCCLTCGFPTVRGVAACEACHGSPLDPGVADGRHLMNVGDTGEQP